jgi:hypothetical protein
MMRSTVLQHLKTHIARLLAARFTVLTEESNGFTRGWWHDFEIGHYVDGRIARLLCACRRRQG